MAELSRSEQRFLDSYWNNRQYEGGRMYRCSFANARLSNIGLKKEIDIQSSVWFWSKLTNIRCSGLRMVVGHCEECTFWSVILDDTVMAGFRFVKSVILGCQFTDTTLSNLRLKKCEMSHLKLSKVKLIDVVFDRCIFKELDLEHITFEKVK